MKRLLAFLVIIFSCWLPVHAQALHVDSTRFITGDNPGTSIRFAIPTADKGILFVGEDYGNPGGIIPYFPIDMGVNGNVLIGKIDSNQQISWIRVYGGSDADGAQSVCQTPDGGYAVFAGTISDDGDISGYRGGGGDFWLLRLDAAGNLLWEKTYGSTAQDAPISIASTRDHGFIMLGLTNGSNDDVPFHYGDFFSFDWLVVKTDSLGNKQWSKDVGGTGNEGYGSILAIDSAYFIVANSTSADYDCTDTAWHAGINTSNDYYVLKLNDTGKVLWDSSYGGSGDDAISYAMFDNRDSTIMAIGTSTSSDYMITGAHGQEDMWVIKVNRNGKLIWQKALGGTQEEGGTGICEAQNGGYMAYGSTYPGPIGGVDAWLFNLDSVGNEKNNMVFGGVQNEDEASVVPYLGGYVATGISGSAVFTEGSCDTNYSGAFVSYIDSSTLGVHNINISKPSFILVYPNPANEEINVKTSGNTAGMATIVNGFGGIVFHKQMKSGEKSIAINNWANGVYIIEWEDADGAIITEKFIKE